MRKPAWISALTMSRQRMDPLVVARVRQWPLVARIGLGVVPGERFGLRRAPAKFELEPAVPAPRTGSSSDGLRADRACRRAAAGPQRPCPAEDVVEPVDRAPGDEHHVVGLAQRLRRVIDRSLDEAGLGAGPLRRKPRAAAIAFGEKSSPVTLFAPRCFRLSVSRPMWHWRWTMSLPERSPISPASSACSAEPPASTLAMR